MAKGWTNESARHSMSAYGIKTGQKKNLTYIVEGKKKVWLPIKMRTPTQRERVKEQTETELLEQGFDSGLVGEFMVDDFQNLLSVDENVDNFKKMNKGEING
jgi:hypothetical protein